MSLFAPIRKVSGRPDGTLDVEASFPAADANAVELAEALHGFSAGDGVRTAGRDRVIAAGVISSLGVGDDGIFRVAARVVDDGVVAKVRHGVLKFFEITSKWINLTDLGGGESVNMWKSEAADMTEQLSPFAKAFMAEFTKAMGDTLAKAAVETEHDRAANSANAGRLSSMNEADPVTITQDEPSTMLEDALLALRVVEHDEAPDRHLAIYRVGYGEDLYSMLRSNSSPRKDILAGQIERGGGRVLDMNQRPAIPGPGGREPPPQRRQTVAGDGSVVGWSEEQNPQLATVT